MPNKPASQDFAQRVIDWQAAHGRHHLPWQQSRDPYRVWLSEIMLQQTQVSTVIGYFERFLTRLPTVTDLAQASEEEVMALWAGLGYYARARHLHACAKTVVNQCQGQFPRTSQELQTLPGIGPSTAAAIAAFCSDERSAILDGNVKRVLARYFGIDGDVSHGTTIKQLWALANSCLPSPSLIGQQPKAMTSYTQGLMDLGATLCTRREPACERCPLADRCVAHHTGRTQELPFKRKAAERPTRELHLLWVTHGSQVLLQRRPDKGIWGRLWCLPMFDSASLAQNAVDDWLAEPLPCTRMASIGHDLTHFRLTLTPWRLALPDTAIPPVLANAAGQWICNQTLANLGLPKPIKTLLVGGNPDTMATDSHQ
uniref:A/G-specific adenine glycosylase n=1 Tax=Orrella sp. TaxID=1921583 RepID=UPI0040473376